MHEMCTKRKQDVQQGLLIVFQYARMRSMQLLYRLCLIGSPMRAKSIG